jgi:AcrR family transcriptional regulator
MAASKKTVTPEDLSTEERILTAARTVFTSKGYAATRTRDIAEAAGINLALLNYYFRSKEKLFHLIMAEKVQQLFGVIAPVVRDEHSSLEAKLEQLAADYIDLLSANPDLPLFVLSEIRNNPQQFQDRLGIDKLLIGSALLRQIQEKRPDINPLQFVINMLGMCVFPFVGRSVLFAAGATDQQQFDLMMTERKRLIPLWLKAMLKVK